MEALPGRELALRVVEGKVVKVGEPAIQCCPQCNGTLFHIESEAHWIADAGRYESNGHPDYVAILRWGRGQCFPNAAILANRFRKANPVGYAAE